MVDQSHICKLSWELTIFLFVFDWFHRIYGCSFCIIWDYLIFLRSMKVVLGSFHGKFI